MLINGWQVKFTSTENKLVPHLLTQETVLDSKLIIALGFDPTDGNSFKLVVKYISQIRGKLKAHGLKVSRYTEYGYKLVKDGEQLTFRRIIDRKTEIR